MKTRETHHRSFCFPQGTSPQKTLFFFNLIMVLASSFLGGCRKPQEQLTFQDQASLRTLSSSPLSARADEGTMGLKAGQVVITWDDGPGPYTENLAKHLKHEGVPSTFFVLGRQVKRFPNALKTIQEQGHLVGNHTFSHQLGFATLPPERQAREVLDTHALIQKFVSPAGHFLLRSPGGSWSKEAAEALRQGGLDNYTGHVGWDVGGTLSATTGADWACWNQDFSHPETKNGALSIQECGSRYLAEIDAATRKNRGVIVLMHDIHKNTVDMFFEVILPALRQRQVSFLRADQVPLIKKHIETSLLAGNTKVTRTVGNAADAVLSTTGASFSSPYLKTQNQ